ncbi:MAG: RNA methyltransferase [Muribaculaceae bacterium]|nr:RNA methyltransferase [Muribaculaceae bacterium]
MEISKAKIKLYASLGRRKQRDIQHLFIAEGVKCVEETLDFFELEALVIEKSLVEEKGIPSGVEMSHVYEVNKKQIEQISGLSTPPRMVAVYRQPRLIVPEPQALRDELVLVLDGVQDPGNLGTIMRAADWFGVKHIIASHQTVDIFNPKAVQATMGAIGRVHISYTDLPAYVATYKAQTSLPVYGTLLNGRNMYAAPLSATGMIIMGNEGQGLTEEIKALIDAPLLIPSYPLGSPTVESLNVAMATAITLAEFRRKLLL